jgi:hypothetical protein
VRWREGGASLTELVPVSSPGLKTRFDELLVDDDADLLFERVREFLRCEARDLPAFARKFGLPGALEAKLQALKRESEGTQPRREAVRPFLRYRGPRPMGAPAFCYLERRLIPRGDHRFRGDYDPHLEPVKLVFNQHELPLAAHLIETPGCVTAYRHSRFAPLYVPRPLLEGAKVAGPEDALVPNLSAKGLAWAALLGNPRAVFAHIAAHVMSEPFQRGWAPMYGRLTAPLIAPP